MSPQGVKCMCYMKHKLLKVGKNLTTSNPLSKKKKLAVRENLNKVFFHLSSCRWFERSKDLDFYPWNTKCLWRLGRQWDLSVSRWQDEWSLAIMLLLCHYLDDISSLLNVTSIFSSSQLISAPMEPGDISHPVGIQMAPSLDLCS